MKKFLTLCLLLPVLFFVSCIPGENLTPSQYTVTFNSDGGSTVRAQDIEEGALASRPFNPLKIDHAFRGWFTDAERENEYNFSTPVTESFTLYAKWELLMRITFVTNSNTVIPYQNTENGGKANKPNNPRKGGFTFLGWFLSEENEDEYDFNSAVTGNITLFAKWIASIYESIGEKDGLSDQTAMEYFAAKGIFLGWNAGNALDAPTETAWSPKLTQELFNAVKDYGFNMVRIPVTWVNANRPIGPAPDYLLNPERLELVAEIVDMAYNAGLAAVINVHHDGSGRNSWLSVYNAARDENGAYDRITAQFKRAWEQIAERFKDYGDWLIFESFNELHDGGWGWGSINTREFGVLNEWNQIFTDVVRSSGSNNAERFLIVKAYCAKPHQTLADTFVLPTDTIADKQIVSFHYYDPEPFALRGTVTNWGTNAHKLAIANEFVKFKTKFVDIGIPVVIGESGAVYQIRTDPVQQAEANASRLAYFSFMCGTARDNGLVPIYWDNATISSSGEKFGLFNRNTAKPYTDREEELINAMVDAVQ
ncbi:MAG: cellulase family glycosylhydrolase [Treponema sp.]|nr:cellulase family glycosylhydrolase [Treponema sp.]